MADDLRPGFFIARGVAVCRECGAAIQSLPGDGVDRLAQHAQWHDTLQVRLDEKVDK